MNGEAKVSVENRILTHSEAVDRLERLIRWSETASDAADIARDGLRTHFAVNASIGEHQLLLLLVSGDAN